MPARSTRQRSALRDLLAATDEFRSAQDLHTLLLARRFDERLLSLQRQGRIGTFPPISGQEAAHLGAAAVLKPKDWMVPAFREMAAALWRGQSLESIVIYNNG